MLRSVILISDPSSPAQQDLVHAGLQHFAPAQCAGAKHGDHPLASSDPKEIAPESPKCLGPYTGPLTALPSPLAAQKADDRQQDDGAQ